MLKLSLKIYPKKLLTLKERLKIFREWLYFKSIKDLRHKDRIEGPISKSTTTAILNAIEGHFLLTIYYIGDKQEKAGWRTVEPYCYGLNRFTQNHVLRAYQESGPSFSGRTPYWRMFRLDRIFNIALSTKTFDKPKPLWNPTGDLGMSTILAIITFKPIELGDTVKFKVQYKQNDPTTWIVFQIDKPSNKAMVMVNIDEEIRPVQIVNISQLVRVQPTDLLPPNIPRPR